MENLIVTLCNETSLNILGHTTTTRNGSIGSSIKYLDPCFQEAFLVTPIYLILLSLLAFYLGAHQYRPQRRVSLVLPSNWLIYGRFSSILFVLALQISIPLVEFPHLNLLSQLTCGLKLLTTLAHLRFLFTSQRVTFLERRFLFLKLFFLFIIAVSVSESVTFYFVSPKIVACILSSLLSLGWSLHFVFLLKRDTSAAFAAERLIEVEGNEHVDGDDLLHGDEGRSLLSQLFFGWVGPLLDRGLDQAIASSVDLFVLPSSLDSRTASTLADQYLDDPQVTQSPTAGKHYLIRCLFRRFGGQLLLIGAMKLLADIFSFLSPIFLNRILLYLQNPVSESSYSGFTFAGALCLATLLNALIISSFNFQMSKLSLKLRSILISTIYHKLYRIRATDLVSQFGTGTLLNLANTDIERVVNFAPSLYQFISLPLQLVITLLLLYNQVGIVFLSAVLFILALIPLNRVICNRIGAYSTEMMKWKDRRIKLMTEILRGIRTIKMHFWERSFIEKVTTYRTSEVRYLMYRKYLDALCVYFWATTPVIISSLVFGTYASLNGTDSLTASMVFTSLALLGMLIMPLNALPWVLNGLIEALVSVRRLDRFFVLTEVDLSEDYVPLQEHDRFAFQLDNCTFTYVNSEQIQLSASNGVANGIQTMGDHFKLSRLDFQLPKRSFLGVVGKVGSGKSSLLKCLLNELPKNEGRLAIDPSLFGKGIGYVSQEPWIRDTSIRENVLLGSDYNRVLYNQVLDACALVPDLKLLPNGDQTLVGNHGATLSGGQKSRLALARALYQNFDVYLLDEPFASVDLKVAREIYEKAIQGLLLRQGKTVCLATNHLLYLKEADVILCLDYGTIRRSVTAAEYFRDRDLEESSNGNGASQAFNQRKVSVGEKETAGEFVAIPEEDEERQYGYVRLGVYLSYVASIGYFVFSLILLSVLLMQLSKTTSDFWLSFWTTTHHSLNLPSSVTTSVPYLTIFIGIAIANSLFTLLRAFIFAYGGVKAATVLHDRLLHSVVKTSLLFFDLTAFGIIINRFSSDVFNVDDALPFTLNIFLAQLSGLAASLVVTIYGLPWIALLVLPLVVPYYYIQKYFRATSRELKRLSAVSLSPIYSHLDDTIQGLTTIRSFGQVQHFKESFYGKVDVYNRISYSIAAVQQWLNLRLQLLGVAVTGAVAFIAVYLHFYHDSSISSGLIGLALVYSLSLTGLLNGSVQTFTQTELDLISVERIDSILETIRVNYDLARLATEGSLLVDSSWPANGIIRFNQVKMRYRPHLELALKGVSFVTEPAEHIAIVGRTGSGKSSLFQALFRLTNLESGSISIDGVDISMIDVELLRSKIFIIPQDPFLFSGSIRDNLDPLYAYRDDEIWTALYNCNINILVDSLGGLDAQLRENGSDLSVGQRHLFCLARAVLNRRTILCMDEVTANIDSETEEVLHELVQSSLRQCTVLHIAHKLDSIRHYDRVLVLEGGRLVDVCTPQEYRQRHQAEEEEDGEHNSSSA